MPPPVTAPAAALGRYRAEYSNGWGEASRWTGALQVYCGSPANRRTIPVPTPSRAGGKSAEGRGDDIVGVARLPDGRSFAVSRHAYLRRRGLGRGWAGAGRSRRYGLACDNRARL